MINLFQGGGIYNYSGTTAVQNFQSWASDSFRGQPGDTDPYAGYHYTSFVQTVDQLNTGNRAGADDFWFKMFDGFFEDTWKVRPNFTLTAGVRYDFQLTPPPVKNNTNYAPLSTLYSSTIKNVSDRVQPRVGFAWNPHPGTVVRGGYGLFSGLNQGSTYYAMRVENGVVQVNYNYQSCGAACAAIPANSLQYPNVPFTPTGPALGSSSLYPAGGAQPAVGGPTVLGTQSFHGLDPNFVPPLAHEFEFGIEQALPGKMSLGVGYVGSRALRLPYFVDANLIGQTPSGLRSYNVLDSSAAISSSNSPSPSTASPTAATPASSPTTPASPARTPGTTRSPPPSAVPSRTVSSSSPITPGPTPPTPTRSRARSAPSTAATPRLTPTTSAAKTATPTSTPATASSPPSSINPTFSPTTATSNTSSTTSSSPAPKPPPPASPSSASMSGTVYNGGATSYGAEGNIYGGAISSGSGLATTGRPPQIGRNSLTGPGFNNFDFRISRDVPIHESLKLQFIGEAFNLLNHEIITGVNSTYSQYAPATATSKTCTLGSSAPIGAPLQGCISPYTGTGSAAFGVASSTNNTLYGPRQLQVSAKLFF